MTNIDFGKRFEAVRHYFKGGDSIRKTASKFNVHYRTLFKWVKLYRQHGPLRLAAAPGYCRSRRDPALENKILMLKEGNPSLTVRQARARLAKENIKVSVKKIHGIWSRHNLVKRPVHDPYSPYGPMTPRHRPIMEHLEWLLDQVNNEDAIKEASMILNDMGYFPAGKEELLIKLKPDYLSPRRRLDRLYALENIPVPEYILEIRQTRFALEKSGCLYSSLIAGLLEVNLLSAAGDIRQRRLLITRLRARAGRLHDPVISFMLAYWTAAIHAKMLKVATTFEYYKKCKILLRSLPDPHFYEALFDLMTMITDYRRAFFYGEKALALTRDEADLKRISVKLAVSYVGAGKYQLAQRLLGKAGLSGRASLDGTHLYVRICLRFIAGDISRTLSLLEELLELSKKGPSRNLITVASINLASIARVLGRVRESKAMLKKYLPDMIRNKFEKEAAFIQFFLGRRRIGKELTRFPIYKLLFYIAAARRTMRKSDYRRAIMYAKRKWLLGYFQRHIIFFPELVINAVRLGQKTCLPKSILKYPVFNDKTPVYHLKFLGKTILSLDRKCLKVKLTPREQAVLIFIAQQAGEPGKSVSMMEIYRNFWPGSDFPAGRFSHVLVQIKQKINLPPHLIGVSSRGSVKKLVNRGFYITTDYNDLRMGLAEAKALNQTGEERLAAEKYLKSLRLVRGAPFRKMYDEWSEQARRVILTKIEAETVYFTTISGRLANPRSGLRVLENIVRIIPSADELKKSLDQIITIN